MSVPSRANATDLQEGFASPVFQGALRGGRASASKSENRSSLSSSARAAPIRRPPSSTLAGAGR